MNQLDAFVALGLGLSDGPPRPATEANLRLW
jgi:hypothetical protein